MPTSPTGLKRRNAWPEPPASRGNPFFVEERTLKRAKKALGVPTDAEVVRLSLERAAEMEEFWRFMQQSRRILKPGSIKSP